MVDARKQRYGEADLKQLFSGATKIITARGKRALVLDLKNEPSAAELAQHALGPSGNLRAPALKLGKTWLIGFGEAAWVDFFD